MSTDLSSTKFCLVYEFSFVLITGSIYITELKQLMIDQFFFTLNIFFIIIIV